MTNPNTAQVARAEQPSRFLTPGRFWMGVALCSLGLMVAFLFARDHAIAKRWKPMLVELERFQAPLLERNRPRLLLSGDPEPTVAFALYAEGGRIARKLDTDKVVAAQAETFDVTATEPSDAARVRCELVADGEAALQELRAAAFAEESGWPLPPTDSSGGDAQATLNIVRLGTLAWLDVLTQLEAGNSAAAVESMLHTLELVHDLSESPTLIHDALASYLVLPDFAERAFAAGFLAQLDEKALEQLQVALARLLVQTPLYPMSWDYELACSVRMLENMISDSGSMSALSGSLRQLSMKNLWSPRLEIVAHFEITREDLKRTKSILDGGLTGFEEALVFLEEVALDDGNRATALTRSHLPRFLENRARAQAKLRLLAAAVTVLRGAPEQMNASLGDPYLVEHVRLDETPERILLTVDGHSDWRLEIGRE